MDARQKANHAKRLLDDPILNEVTEEAHHDLFQTIVHGATAEIRDGARARYLGIDEIVQRLRYLVTELEMAPEEEE